MCAATLWLLAFAGTSNAATVRDDFDDQLYNNNDGTVNWSGDWVEIDGQGGGPTGGNVWINGGATYAYTPTADANGVDTTVTHIRINPKGDLLGNTGSGDPSFDIYFKAVVQ